MCRTHMFTEMSNYNVSSNIFTGYMNVFSENTLQTSMYRIHVWIHVSTIFFQFTDVFEAYVSDIVGHACLNDISLQVLICSNKKD